MLEYNESVFRRAARAIWDEQDADTKQIYRAKADEEKKGGVSEKKEGVKNEPARREAATKKSVVKKRARKVKKTATAVRKRRKSPRLQENMVAASALTAMAAL